MRQNLGVCARLFRLPTVLGLAVLWSLSACDRPVAVADLSDVSPTPACLADVVPLDFQASSQWLSHWQRLSSDDCRPDSWLVRFPETGQNIAGFRADASALGPTPQRLQVVTFGGRLAARGRALLPLVREFSELFFQVEVRVSGAQSLPAGASEVLRSDAGEQYDAVRILDLLGGSCPDTTACLLVTDHDIYMPGLQYVFGLANFRHRLSLVSLHRIWTPEGSAVARAGGPQSVEPLRRLLKIAAHELAHQFSLSHCVHYRDCLMAGTSSV